MYFEVFDNMCECTESEVIRMLPLVSEQRRQKALSYGHVFGQYVTLKSYLMLESLWWRYHPRTQSNIEAFEHWQENAYGKPSIDGGMYFSISHTKLGIAVALSEHPIGIDIEGIRTRSNGLIERTMNEQEQSVIQNALYPDVSFIAHWCLKEAMVKCIGTGIQEDIHNILSPLKDTNHYLTRTIINLHKGYIVAVIEDCK